MSHVVTLDSQRQPETQTTRWRRAMVRTKQAAIEVKSEWQMWARTLLICLTFVGAAMGFAYWLGNEFTALRQEIGSGRDLMLRVAAATVTAADERAMQTDAYISIFTVMRDTERTIAGKRRIDAALDKLNEARKRITRPYFPELENMRANPDLMQRK